MGDLALEVRYRRRASRSRFLPCHQTKMEPNQESAFIEAFIASEYAQATKSMADQLVQFIDFIQHHNPEVERIAATQAAAFFLQDLRTAFLEEPEMMQQLRAIALHFSQL